MDKDLPLPVYETDGSVGFDILAREDVTIETGAIALVPGNIIVEVPRQYMLIVASRSSTPKKKGLSTPHGFGIIDHDYCGPQDEIKIQVYNFTDKVVTISRGEKVAQGVFVHIDKFEWEEVDHITAQSRGGFGSTDAARGRLITLYGINNIGKTTHATLLVKNLRDRGVDAVYLKYPVYSLAPSGIFLNKILRTHGKQKISEEELQLWFVLNRYQFQPKLKEMLDSGKTVIAEDYCGTGIAWGHAKGMNLKTLEGMNKFFIQEDASILLEGPRRLSAREKKHVHESNDALVRRCAVVFKKLAKKYDWEKIHVMDDIDKTAQKLLSIVLVKGR